MLIAVQVLFSRFSLFALKGRNYLFSFHHQPLTQMLVHKFEWNKVDRLSNLSQKHHLWKSYDRTTIDNEARFNFILEGIQNFWFQFGSGSHEFCFLGLQVSSGLQCGKCARIIRHNFGIFQMCMLHFRKISISNVLRFHPTTSVKTPLELDFELNLI